MGMRLSSFSIPLVPESARAFTYPTSVACGNAPLRLDALRLHLSNVRQLPSGVLVVPFGTASASLEWSLEGGPERHLGGRPVDEPWIGTLDANGALWLSGRITFGSAESCEVELRAKDLSTLVPPVAHAAVRKAGRRLILDGTASAQSANKDGEGVTITHYFWSYRDLEAANPRMIDIGDGPRLEMAAPDVRAQFVLLVVNSQRQHAVSAVVVDPDRP